MGVLLLAAQATVASAARPELLQAGKALNDPSRGESGGFGHPVAMSADGDLAAVAAPGDDEGDGAIYLYRRDSAGGWALERAIERQPLINGSGTTWGLGTATALSADGSTLVATAEGNNWDEGVVAQGHYVWVYHLNSPAAGPEQLPYPGQAAGGEHGPIDSGCCGVAVSADGNTIVAGYFFGVTEMMVVYAWRNGEWHIEAELTGEKGPSNHFGGFGIGVALTPNAQTLLIGAPLKESNQGHPEVGGAYDFTQEEPGQWIKAALTPEQPLAELGEYGSSVAVSADGQTALVGSGRGPAPGYENGANAAWAFERTATGWVQKGAPITGELAFGETVALSADGRLALVSGSPDHTALFSWADGSWTRVGLPLVPREEWVGRQPTSVALSASGSTAILGLSGAAWIFEEGDPASAEVCGVSAHFVRASGQETVTIRGHGLSTAKAVLFGPRSTTFAVESGEALRATVPAGADGERVHISVQTDEGWTQPTEADEVQYVRPAPPPSIKKLYGKKGPASGGTTVTITGENLDGVNRVLFGAGPATRIENVSSQEVRVWAPANVAETVPITITTPNGESAPSTRFAFKYERPIITGLSSNSGPLAGGHTTTLTGFGFKPGTNATSFSFKKAISGQVECSSPRSCTVLVPAATKTGTVDVTAAVGKAKSTKDPPSDTYTYE